MTIPNIGNWPKLWQNGYIWRYGRYVTWCQGFWQRKSPGGWICARIHKAPKQSKAKQSKAKQSGICRGQVRQVQDISRLQKESGWRWKTSKASDAIEVPCKAMDKRIYLGFMWWLRAFSKNIVSYWFILYLLADLCQVEFLLKIAQWCPVMPSVSQDQEILLAWAWGYSLPPSCFNLKVQVSASVIARTITLWMVKFEAVLQFR